MSSPVRDARERILASDPTAVVTNRGRGNIEMFNPDTKKVIVESEVGNVGWHINGTEIEIDTAIQSTTGAWQYEMVTADYHVHMRDTFNAGNLIEYLDPISGQWVIFDPQSINWVDENSSRQQIAIKQSVTAVISDDLMTFTEGYGAGKHFSYQCQSGRLRKLVTIDNFSDLPIPTVQGNEVWFESEFSLSTSTDMTIWLDDVEWQKINGERVKTANRIEFRDLAGETVFWWLDFPRASDSDSNQTIGEMEVRRQGAGLFITVRIPYAWMSSAVYPVYVDPTVDPQVSASADDGWNESNQSTSIITNTADFYGEATLSHNPHRTGGLRFQLNVPQGVTIDTAYVLVSGNFGSTSIVPVRIAADDVDDSVAWVTTTDIMSQITSTAAAVAVKDSKTYAGDTLERLADDASDEIKSVVQEIVTRGGFASGNYINIVLEGFNGDSDFQAKDFTTYDGSTSLAATLHVEYTSASSLTQEGFRFRNDDGSETAATWMEVQDTNTSLAKADPFRLRVLIEETLGAAVAKTFQIEYRKRLTTAPDTWTDWVVIE